MSHGSQKSVSEQTLTVVVLPGERERGTGHERVTGEADVLLVATVSVRQEAVWLNLVQTVTMMLSDVIPS